MRDYLQSVVWTEILEKETVQEKWDQFSDVLEGAIRRFIPTHTSQGNKKESINYT